MTVARAASTPAALSGYSAYGLPRTTNALALPASPCDDAPVPLLPGAEPWSHPGGSVGALLVHGFTGSPQSLRPWAEHLAAAGLSVELPRLPGHGTSSREMALTRWPDWYAEAERALLDLQARCAQVFVMGLSMGGALSLRLAEVHGRAVTGLVLVNPSVLGQHPLLRALPLLQHVLPTYRGVSNDIKKPGVRELAYDRIPLRCLASLVELWAVVRRDLPQVTQPILLFRSAVDHVVEPTSAHTVKAHVSSTVVEERVLLDSYHVATLDNEAAQIFEASLEFVRRHTRAVTEDVTT